MLVSEDEDLIARARFLAAQAREPTPHYSHSTLGYNYRMSNLLAAVGRAQLNVLEQRIAQRRAIFEFYRSHLRDLPGLDFMPEADYGRPTRWLTCIQVDPKLFGVDRRRNPAGPRKREYRVTTDMDAPAHAAPFRRVRGRGRLRLRRDLPQRPVLAQ